MGINDIINNHDTIKNLQTIEKIARKVIYNERAQLSNVLRFSDWGTILPVKRENLVREKLTEIRDNNKDIKSFNITKNWEELVATKKGNYRTFKIGNQIFSQLQSSGNTYVHTGKQAIVLHKYSDIALEKWDIDSIQYYNDMIRAVLHDRSEKITDDIPPFLKDANFKNFEKQSEEKLIDEKSAFSPSQKAQIKEILSYGKNSRFKMYEHLLSMRDIIDMKNNALSYNEPLSVIYQVFKNTLPKFLWTIQLDNGNEVNIIEQHDVQSFFKDHSKEIDETFQYLKDNKEKLFNEHRFKEWKYDKKDVAENFDTFRSHWEQIKKEIGIL